jgi:uncharacterized RDD family membrane protein YckC
VSPEETPSLGRRLACVLYDALPLLALLFVASFIPFMASMAAFGLQPDVSKGAFWWLINLYWLAVAGAYFTFFWRKGQTLGMKTWKLRLQTPSGGLPGWGRVWLRYVFACLNLAALGLGWWSATLRADRQFLQDVFAGTRLVKAR